MFSNGSGSRSHESEKVAKLVEANAQWYKVHDEVDTTRGTIIEEEGGWGGEVLNYRKAFGLCKNCVTKRKSKRIDMFCKFRSFN